MKTHKPESTPKTRVAEVWRAYWEAHGDEFEGEAPRFYLDPLRRVLGEVSGKRLLEAGGGTGRLSKALATHGAHAFLLDIVPEVARRATFNSSLRGLAADLFRMPFADGTFDAVFNHGVMEHFEPPLVRQGIAEMARVLRPGGKLVVIVPSDCGRFYVKGKQQQEASGEWPYGVEYPQPSLASIGEAAGLRSLTEEFLGVRWQTRFLRGWRRRLAGLLVRPFAENSRLGAALWGAYLMMTVWEKPA